MIGPVWKSMTLTEPVGKLVGYLITIVSRASFGISVNFRSLALFWGVDIGQ